MERPEALARFLATVPTVRDEVAAYRGMSPEQKLLLVRAACQMGAKLARLSPDPEATFARRDPPDPSWATIERRLRERGGRR